MNEIIDVDKKKIFDFFLWNDEFQNIISNNFDDVDNLKHFGIKILWDKIIENMNKKHENNNFIKYNFDGIKLILLGDVIDNKKFDNYEMRLHHEEIKILYIIYLINNFCFKNNIKFEILKVCGNHELSNIIKNAYNSFYEETIKYNGHKYNRSSYFWDKKNVFNFL